MSSDNIVVLDYQGSLSDGRGSQDSPSGGGGTFDVAGTREEPRSAIWRACIAMLGLSVLVLVVLVATGGSQVVYDEPWYLGTVSLIHEHGLSAAFLLELPGPAGPLYSVVHYLLEPITGRVPPGARLVNVGFVVLTLCSLYGLLRFVPTHSRRLAALSLMAVPMTWAMGGLALTEFPAIALATTALYLLFVAIHRREGSRGLDLLAAGLALAGGFLFGLAVLGRQPLLVIAFAVPLLAIRAYHRLPVLALFALGAAPLPLMVFAVWGDVLPPETVYVGGGISIPHGLLGVGYAGVLIFLLAPMFMRTRTMIVAGLIAGSLAINAAVPILRITPLQGIAERVLSPAMMSVYGYVAGSMLFALAGITVWAILRSAWAMRGDPTYVFVCVATLFVLGTIATNTAQFSSRYVGTAAPLLIATVAPSLRADRFAPVRLGLGLTAGILSLLTYFWSAVP